MIFQFEENNFYLFFLSYLTAFKIGKLITWIKLHKRYASFIHAKRKQAGPQAFCQVRPTVDTSTNSLSWQDIIRHRTYY